MNKKDTIQLKVEPELKQKLQKMADESNRTLSDFVRLQLIMVTSYDLSLLKRALNQISARVSEIENNNLKSTKITS